MKKAIYTYDDLVELLAEQAIGTEVMQQIEEFCKMKQSQHDWQLKRLREAALIIGYSTIDECVMYE